VLDHAVLHKEPVLGNEPFALFLADFLVHSGNVITSDIIKGFEKAGKTQLNRMVAVVLLSVRRINRISI
jgi:UTP-glucose-1-phosphate uridylyltransferase